MIMRNGVSVYRAYAQAVKSRRLDGPRVHFDKGFWLRGENERLDNGTHAVAFAPELKIGWQFWLDGEPGDEVTGLLSQGFQPPPRSSLGDMDKTLWERKADGTPKDPWSKVNLLPLVLPKTNEVCTYTTTSKGGFAAVGELCEAFDTAPPDMLPLIALEADSYTHKEFGRVWVPVLKVLKYVPAARSTPCWPLCGEGQSRNESRRWSRRPSLIDGLCRESQAAESRRQVKTTAHLAASIPTTRSRSEYA
jgi:hypothetical protein